MNYSDDVIQFIKMAKDQEGIKFPDFNTHLNYLEFMMDESKNLSLHYSCNIQSQFIPSPLLQKKMKLIGVTYENIKGEMIAVKKEPEYAEVCCAWIPVKAYYLFYHLILVLEYLISCDTSFLQKGHHQSRKIMKSYLANKELIFNNVIFNEVYHVKEVLNWKIPVGENIKSTSANKELRKKQILKKLIIYKKEEFKRSKNIIKLTGTNLKEFHDKVVSLFEFFYFYRVKVNYRDLEFMKEGLTPRQYQKFYLSYIQLAWNFYKAMRDCINQLSMIRFGKNIL